MILWAHTGAIGCIVIYIHHPSLHATINQLHSIQAHQPHPPTLAMSMMVVRSTRRS